MKRILLLATLFFTCLAAQAQNSISGKVIDSLTHEPIAFASIYFANTTYGTTTGDDGRFTLHHFPDGKYDLTVSYIGYHTVQLSLEFSNTTRQLTFSLLQKPTELTEIVVSPDTSNRRHNIQLFKQAFLGTGKNSASCKIANLNDLYIDFDPQDGVITAFSRKPLEVTNQALGYKVIYDLHHFEIDYRRQQQVYLGIPRFEKLTPKNANQLKRWEKERKEAYLGSFTHFIHLLQQGDLKNEFEVQELFRVPNRERPPNAVLNEKIKIWRLKSLNPEGRVINNAAHDSLDYYIKLKRKPELVDSLGRLFVDVSPLLDTARNNIIYTGMLRLTYKNEKEDLLYAQQNGRAPLRMQYSVVHFLQPVAIYDNGYYEDVRNVFFEGYLGWSEKIADILPLGYVPLADGKK